MHQHPGAKFMLRVNSTGQHYLGTGNMTLASVDVTVVSSLKGLKSHFIFFRILHTLKNLRM